MIGSAEKSSFVFTSISQSYCIKLDPYELGRNHLLVMIDSLASSLMSATYYSFRAAAIRYFAPHAYESEFEHRTWGPR